MTSRGHSALFPRSFRKKYPIAVRGEGAWIWDAEGNRYLDFAGSAAVNFIGHGDKTVANAITAQLGKLEFAHTSQFTAPIAEQFAKEVLEFAGPAFEGGAVFFTSGGSEAVETALKLARQFQVEAGEAQRTKFLSRNQAYHGATFGAMGVSGNRKRREVYLPLLLDSEKINTPYCYRCAYGCDQCAKKYADEVELALQKSGDETAAFIFEPVSGATIGAAAPPDGYLRRIVESCRARGVLVIADEVMTGFGRTGRNFAVNHWGVEPDMLVVAKGIASGYAPLGAVIANRRVVEAIEFGSGSLIHGLTYNAHALAVAAGQAALARILECDLVRAADSSAGCVGARFKAALQNLLDCGSVGDVRGLGLLWGVEFVIDRSSKKPFDPNLQFSPLVGVAAARRGVMVYPMQGCVDGVAGDHILLAPPAILQEQELQWGVEQLKLAIQEVESQ